MVKLESREYKLKQPPKKDIILNIWGLELYFENTYAIFSLINDVFTGFLYLGASTINILDGPPKASTFLYLLGAVSLTLRPFIKIVQNIYIYKAKKRPVRFKKEDRFQTQKIKIGDSENDENSDDEDDNNNDSEKDKQKEK